MSVTTNYFEELLTNTMLRGEPFPTIDYHLGLWVSSPGKTGAGTEVSDVNYQRLRVAWTPWSTTSENTNEKRFPAAASGFTFRYFVLSDAASGGNVLVYHDTLANNTVNTGAEVFINVGDLQVNVT